MTNIKPCRQNKCDFRKESPLAHNCPICASCGCKPHEVDWDCVECCQCESDEGSIRNGTPDLGQEEQKEKIIIEVKQ